MSGIRERLKTMAVFKREGIACGMFLLPAIPFITDTPEMIEETLRKAQEVGVDFVIFGSMTLKEGRQKDYFDNVLKERYPELVANMPVSTMEMRGGMSRGSIIAR